MNITHFYHAFVDGYYEEAIAEHATALKKYGLYDNLDEFFISIIGSKDNCNKLINELNDYNIIPTEYIYFEQGFEQVTMELIKDYVQNKDNVIFYAHTKATYFNVGERFNNWRANMCYYDIVNWKKQYEMLKFYDTAGCYWHREGLDGSPQHYVGTYWWANASYIRTLPDLDYSDRWQAEFWIGKNPNINPFDIADDPDMYAPAKWNYKEC